MTIHILIAYAWMSFAFTPAQLQGFVIKQKDRKRIKNTYGDDATELTGRKKPVSSEQGSYISLFVEPEQTKYTHIILEFLIKDMKIYENLKQKCLSHSEEYAQGFVIKGDSTSVK